MAHVGNRVFNKGLWVSGPRDQSPEGSLRRARGIHQIHTSSVRSRHGSALVEALANAHSLFRFNDRRFIGYDEGDFGKLKRVGDALPLVNDFPKGRRLPFIVMPPQFGKEDYLFVAAPSTAVGGLVKIDKAGAVTKWGIDPPGDSFIATPAEEAANVIIDEFDQNPIVTSVFPDLSGSYILTGDPLETTPMEMVSNGGGPTGRHAEIRVPGGRLVHVDHRFAVPNPPDPEDEIHLDRLSKYVPSGEQDWIQFWIKIDRPDRIDFIQLAFDLESTFDFVQAYAALLTTDDGTVPDNTQNVIATENAIRLAQLAVPIDSKTLLVPGPFMEVGLIPIEHQRSVQVIGPTQTRHITHSVILPFQGTQKLPNEADTWRLMRIPKSAFKKSTNFQPTEAPDDEFTWHDAYVYRLFIKTKDGPSSDGVVVSIDDMRLAGGVGVEGDYQYHVTFKNSVTGSRSNPNTTPFFVSDVGRQVITVGPLPVSNDPQVDTVEIWRTIGDGTVFFLAGEVANGSLQFVDRVADIDLLNDLVPSLPSNGPITTAGISDEATIIDPEDVNALGADPTGIILTANGIERVITGIVELSPLKVKLDAAVDWSSGPEFTITLPSRVLGSDTLEFNNLAPPTTFFDATGPHNGRMYWLSNDPAERGGVFFSPQGRPESVADFIDVAHSDEHTSRVVRWNDYVWVFTTARIYQIVTSGELQFAREIFGAPGTLKPWTIVPTPRGILYQADDGVRVFDGTQSQLIAHDAIATLFHDEGSEDVPSFDGLIATASPSEYFVSDGGTLLALDLRTMAWREVGLAINALYYETDTKLVIGATAAKVLVLEAEGALTDDGDAIAFEIETVASLTGVARKGLLQRVYVELDTNGQQLTPTLVLDNSEIALAIIQTVGRQTVEFARSDTCRVIGVRLTGQIVEAVEIFGVHYDMRLATAVGEAA